MRRAAGNIVLRKYNSTNSYGEMSVTQSLPNGRFELPAGTLPIVYSLSLLSSPFVVFVALLWLHGDIGTVMCG